jgi:hypothetical protein
MSSDTFHIRVTKIDGTNVEFHCFTGTAGGLNDCALTRSFALMIILDGMPYASAGKGTPLQLELQQVSGAETPPVWEESFHAAHVAKYIAKAKIIERIGIIYDIPAWQHARFELNQEDECPLHQFIFHAQVTDPKWLEGLEEGSYYGTTAFDAWWNDPKRQSERELEAITRKASRWVGPGQFMSMTKSSKKTNKS